VVKLYFLDCLYKTGKSCPFLAARWHFVAEPLGSSAVLPWLGRVLGVISKALIAVRLLPGQRSSAGSGVSGKWLIDF